MTWFQLEACSVFKWGSRYKISPLWWLVSPWQLSGAGSEFEMCSISSPYSECFVCTALWTTVSFFSAVKVRRLRDPKQSCTQSISSSSRAAFQGPTWGQNLLRRFLASGPMLRVCFQLNPVLAYSLRRGKCCVGSFSCSVSWRWRNEAQTME